jgi:molybdate transport system substrate-binding protein
MKSFVIKYLLIVLGLVAWCGQVWAASTHVAVASNFTAPAKEIAKAFQKETGHKAILSFGSTGKLFAQIKNGAPFEVFLAADQKRPALLKGEKFTYALGKLALYPADNQDALSQGNIKRLAIANPKTAPYGAAALQVMEKLGVLKDLRPKLVRGENIAQTYQFVSTRNAQLGFVALSQVVSKKRWIVPLELYTPIKQDVVKLEGAGEAAQAFFDFLRGSAAQSIIRQYGYGL